jgi:nucleoside 2-deoxyribosyltransferase
MDCPICKLPEKDVTVVRQTEDRSSVTCARCGPFEISGTARAMAYDLPADFKLSAWIRNRSDTSDLPLITAATLDEAGKGFPRYRVSEKQMLFLRALEQRTEYAGQRVRIVTEFDFTLAWCTGAKEFEYIIRALMGRALVDFDKSSDPADAFALELTITPSGWTFLDETAKPASLLKQVFVAMSFAPELHRAWIGGIEPAISKAGFQPYRVDSTPHIDRIDTKIVAEIRNSRFMIADVTQQRPGVYFEAGFAIGLGLPVFWSVREDDLKNVHFDTRQYNHIVWQTEEQLAERLYYSIAAIMGKGAAT